MNSYVLMFNRLGKNSEKAQRGGGGGRAFNPLCVRGLIGTKKLCLPMHFVLFVLRFAPFYILEELYKKSS